MNPEQDTGKQMLTTRSRLTAIAGMVFLFVIIGACGIIQGEGDGAVVPVRTPVVRTPITTSPTSTPIPPTPTPAATLVAVPTINLTVDEVKRIVFQAVQPCADGICWVSAVLDSSGSERLG